MAVAAVTLLLENVSQLLNSNADLISGAEDELQLMKNELDLLKSVFRDAANKPKEEEPFREMEREIKKVVYDTEDTIDSYLTEAAAAKSKNPFLRGLNTRPVSLAEKVRSLREDKVKPVLDKARIDFAHMQIDDDGSATTPEQPRTLLEKVPSSIGSILGVEDTVVGFEEDEASILSRLTDTKRELDFITICGMAGLGKTTLARKIYQNPIIEHEFPTRIWVYVSQDFNIKDVFLNILKGVTSKDMSSMSNHELAVTVRDFLENRKFFLVLDDVWTSDNMIAIRRVVLPKSSKMSTILVTTRNRIVAAHAGLYCGLRALTEHESWELLKLRVFGILHDCPLELMDSMKNLVRKCGGVPLAIVMLAGVLVDQFSRTQSMSALRNTCVDLLMHMKMIPDARPFLLTMVAFSYSRLPDSLRDCFLYLGMFPEDYEISASTLIRLWVAEGFIQHNYQGQSLEETAEENLKHLINRNLVMVGKVRPDGKVKTCRVHDMVRDFCITESGGNTNLFREIRRFDERTSESPILDLQLHRRICIHSDVLDLFSSEPYVPGVRSFLCFSKTESTLLREETSKVPRAFKLLRVLDMRPIRFARFPFELMRLACLRYIALSGNFKVLPEDVSRLRNTQTLTIQTSSRTLEIKADIWKMLQLRHVKTNASIILHKKPENSTGGQKLQTLVYLSPESCTNDVFDRACNLKKLGIRGTLSMLLHGEVGSRKFDNLEKLKDLENLKLVNDVHVSSPSEGPLPYLPPPGRFPRKLRCLTLSATFLNWERMSVLGPLENLEVLKLKDNAFVGECWEVVYGVFRSLLVLQIGYTDLVVWRATGRHFPRLRHLTLRNCEKLEALPEGLANVRSLKEIDLLRPTKTAAASARKIQEYSGIKLSIYLPDE